MFEAVRETYYGPLTIPTDLLVWNVTDEQVVVREVIASEDVQSTGTSEACRLSERWNSRIILFSLKPAEPSHARISRASTCH